LRFVMDRGVFHDTLKIWFLLNKSIQRVPTATPYYIYCSHLGEIGIFLFRFFAKKPVSTTKKEGDGAVMERVSAEGAVKLPRCQGSQRSLGLFKKMLQN
jgi:hypothetical protein